jgi:hypothetical protein
MFRYIHRLVELLRTCREKRERQSHQPTTMLHGKQNEMKMVFGETKRKKNVKIAQTLILFRPVVITAKWKRRLLSHIN